MVYLIELFDPAHAFGTYPPVRACAKHETSDSDDIQRACIVHYKADAEW